MACDLRGIIRTEAIPDASVRVPAPEVRAAPRLSNRRLEFELGAGFEGSCGFALVLALSQMMEHGLGPFGRADLHPRRNPLDRQSRFAPQPGSDGQLAGVAAPASGQLGLLPAPARQLLRDDAVASLLGGLPVEFPGVALPKLTLHQLQQPSPVQARTSAAGRLPLYAKGLIQPVLKGQSAVKWRHGGEQGGVGFLAC